MIPPKTVQVSMRSLQSCQMRSRTGLIERCPGQSIQVYDVLNDRNLHDETERDGKCPSYCLGVDSERLHQRHVLLCLFRGFGIFKELIPGGTLKFPIELVIHMDELDILGGVHIVVTWNRDTLFQYLSRHGCKKAKVKSD